MLELSSKMLRVLDGEAVFPPPLWIMRQAGRYLPEYIELRSRQKNFLSFCSHEESIIEATLQPLRRFELDAAILFSDIFILPHAMGYPLTFEERIGPVLRPLTSGLLKTLSLSGALERLPHIFQALKRLRQMLPETVALLGFCGAPWSLACYAFSGRPSADQAVARQASYTTPSLLQDFVTLMTEASVFYLHAQLEAGADAVQIFDTWAGILDEEGFARWCLTPTKEIVTQLRHKNPRARIIGFPKGCAHRLRTYLEVTGVDAIGMDWTVSAEIGKDLQKTAAIQGNLDPLRLVSGGKALREGVTRILESFGKGRFIFNLGHGIRPETPLAHVQDLLQLVREGGSFPR